MGIFGNKTPMSGRMLNWAITGTLSPPIPILYTIQTTPSNSPSAASCQGFLLLGYDQGVMSGLIGAANQFSHEFNSPNAKLQGIIVSIYDIGCAAGCLFCFLFGERFGRKNMILAGGGVMILGTILLGSSTTLAQLLVGRIVTGVGNGFNSSTIPMYQSELCRPENRGVLLSMQGTVTIVGLCIAYWLDYGLSFADGGVQWRFPISFQAFFAVCLVLQMIPLPETPRYLVERGRISEATSVLARLAGKDVPENDEEVVFQRRQIESSLEIESAGGPFRYRELLEGGKIQNFRRLCICCAVNAMQQFTGSNMINYYAPVVYANTMGLSRNLSLILGGCTSLTYLAASFIPLWTVERFGRRALLMVSSVGLCFCFSMASIMLSIGTRPTAYAATAFVFIFQIFLGIGWLPIPWFYPSEVTTTRIRSRGQALGGFINWMCVFTVVQITPIAIDNISVSCVVFFSLPVPPSRYPFSRLSSQLTLTSTVAHIHHLRRVLLLLGSDRIFLLPGNEPAAARGYRPSV
jgi:sugar porter (SP) family MFS transporter